LRALVLVAVASSSARVRSYLAKLADFFLSLFPLIYVSSTTKKDALNEKLSSRISKKKARFETDRDRKKEKEF